MEKVKKLFTKIKNSIKSVLFNYKEFAGLYASMMIVQILLGVWALSAFTNYYANDRLFDSNYKHDITVTGASQTITNISNILRYDVMTDSASFTDFEQTSSASLGVTLKDGQLDRFYDNYLKKLDDDGKIEYELTTKYVYHSVIQKEIITSAALIGIISFLIATLITSVMYSVRTNHYKFQYGIYMTFGADKKMLGSIALGELAAVNVITIIPSAILSYLLLQAVYVGSGVSIVVSFPAILIYVVLSFAVVLLAACSSVGGLFIKPPVALITTADNTNFISSPRRSFNLFGERFPIKYEIFTTWRFRRYVARLVLSAVAFSVIFITGIYCANMIKTDNEASNEEFILKYKYSTYVEEFRDQANRESEELIDAFLSLDGVDKVTFEQSEGFKGRLDHLLLMPGTEVTGAGYSVPSLYEIDGYNRAINNCRYVCIDRAQLENYERMYEIDYLDGYSADTLPQNKDLVVVSESLYGAKCFDFAPGDKIAVAYHVSIDSNMPIESDPKKILTLQINHSTFEYKEYTVGAVIHDLDATESIIIGMNPAEYRSVTEDYRAIDGLEIYLESGLMLEDISALRDEVKKIVSDYPAWYSQTTDEAVFAIVDTRVNLPGLLYLMSILVLLISPIVWIFSQIMFYKKREAEFMMLHSMGATMKEIGLLHLTSGALIFAVSFIANLTLSRLLCYVIYRIFTSVLPHLGIMGTRVSFNSFVPLSTVMAYAAVCAVCGFISSIIPYLLYRKRVAKKEKTSVEQQIQQI